MVRRSNLTEQRPNRVKANFVANLLGRGGLALIHLVTIPVLLRFFTTEEYGMIGLYLSFFPAFLAISMGLNAAYNRVTAQWQAGSFNDQDYHDLSLTLEIVCWGSGLVLFGICILMSGPISLRWLQAVQIPPETIQRLLMLMAAALCFQVPLSLYIAGLNGLQIHIVPNIVLFVSFLLQGVGGIVIVGLISQTLDAYFSWLVIVNGITVLTAKVVFWRCAPPGVRRHVRWVMLKVISGMTMGTGGGVILGVCLVHTDKVILSGLLDLNTYGVYTLAWFVAAAIYLVANPMFTTVFPRMTELLSQNAGAPLIRLYHSAHRYMGCLVFVPAFVVVFFPTEVLLAWTGEAYFAASASVVLPLLMIGCLFNTLGYVPYAAQLAHGWASLALYMNAAALILYIPSVIILTHTYGATGAAAAWAGLYILFFPISLFLMHRRILQTEFVKVFTRDLIPIAFLVIGLLSLWKLAIPPNSDRLEVIFWLVTAGFSSMLLALLSTRSFRQWIVSKLINQRKQIKNT